MYSLPVPPSSALVAVTEPVVQPEAAELNVAVPVPVVLAAAMVTFCAVFQLEGVNVSDAPDCTLRSALPPVALVVATVTLAVGAFDRLTAYVAVPPLGTTKVVGLTTMVDAVVPDTVIPTGLDVVVAPRLSVAFAVSE